VDIDSLDYFRDPLLALDPYGLLDYLAASKPVYREPHHGVVMVTGYEETLAVLRAPAIFSSSTIVAGPDPLSLFPGPPPEGDDITEFINENRQHLPQHDQIVSADPPSHTAQRALLMGLITPKRLKENEEFIWRLTDRQLDEILPRGTAEIIGDYAQPYTLLVIADLLGVPEKDHAMLLEAWGGNRLPGADGGQGRGTARRGPEHNSLEVYYDYFAARVSERRRQPGTDVLAGMAAAKFPDGTTPEPREVARIASNLFAAGQETTVRLIGTLLRRIADEPETQARLRASRDLIPRFVEETLRIEGPIKGEFRLAVKTTELGGVPIPAGTPVMVLNAAASRDSRQFECPAQFRVERENARRHVAFGHGIHTCPGAPLARSEARVTIERLLDRTTDIRISQEAHGPAGDRRYKYMRTYMFRGLTSLHLEFTPRD
jgi:cytochrome P450 family 150 subfamily A5